MAPERFSRESISDLRVGDLIRYKALHQSRTGYIARMLVQGRIEAIVAQSPQNGSSACVEGVLRDDFGSLHPFMLTRKDRVYRLATAGDRSATVRSDRSALGKGQESRGVEQAS